MPKLCPPRSNISKQVQRKNKNTTENYNLIDVGAADKAAIQLAKVLPYSAKADSCRILSDTTTRGR
jgi:hypothetical protein